MKIFVLGATGGTGQQVVTQAISKGHTVTALVRNPQSAQVKSLPSSPALTIVQGNAMDGQALDKTIPGHDAVVISLGSRPFGFEPVCSKGTALIVPAMEKAGIRRVVCVTSLGVGESREHVRGFAKIFIRTVLRTVIADKEPQEEIIRKSSLDWVIVRPGQLVGGPARGNYRATDDGSITGGKVSRADLAEFVLQQLQTDTFLRRCPSLVY